MTVVHGFIPGVVGRLEVNYEVLDPNNWAIICHPHPLYKGSMKNKVVTTVAQACAAQNISWISFNFRGVGDSEGQYIDVEAAYLDCLAVKAWVEKNFCKPNWVIGFSFGAFIAKLLVARNKLVNLVLIAPPVARFGFEKLDSSYNSSLILAENDEIAKLDKALAWAKMQELKQTVIIEQAGHFFHGKLLKLQNNLSQIMSSI